MDHAIDLVKLVLDILVLVAGAAYWAGQVRSRRHMPTIVPARPGEDKSNGHASLGELGRRLQALEADQARLEADRERYVLRTELHGQINGVWGAIKDLRAMDDRQQRRIDRFMGQS